MCTRSMLGSACRPSGKENMCSRRPTTLAIVGSDRPQGHGGPLFDKVSRAVADQRRGVVVERRHDEFTDFADLAGLACVSDNFDHHRFALNVK